MLIDNKFNYESVEDNPHGIKSVWEFIRHNADKDKNQHGRLDIVTGFFSIAGLHVLHRELSPENHYRLILAELTEDEDFTKKVIDLLQGDIGIESSLQLSEQAKNALEFLRRETVEVRAISNAFCHAKSYLFKSDNEARDNFYVMGSSNLTYAGLGIKDSSNIELNIAETGATDKYKSLREWFKHQWEAVAKTKIHTDPKDSKSAIIDVKQYFIERIEQSFARTYTPEEIYYKILFELFHDDLEMETSIEHEREMTLLQDSVIYKKLFDYQKKGVISLIKMLRLYNGAILADAVGLGKTFSALAVIKYYQNNGYQTLLLCPKKLQHNWEQYLRKNGSLFERDDFDYEVRFHTDLQDDRLDNYGRADRQWLKKQKKLLVVIDESHNLRNNNSSRYQMLLNDILNPEDAPVHRDVKVLLLSATPINNGLIDIRNQFNLIGRGKPDAFAREDIGVENLTSLFREAQAEFNKWCERPNRTIGQFIMKLSERSNFFNLTDRLIVARTRKLIEAIQGEALGFPKKLPPLNLEKGVHQLGDLHGVEAIYDAMLAANLTAYQPTQYMKPKDELKKGRRKNAKEKKLDWQDDTYREMFLVKMMAILFMKRLESSWYSCKTTIEKVLEVHIETLRKVNAFLEKRENGGVTSINVETGLQEQDKEELEEFTLRTGQIDLAKMVRVDDFKKGLEHDVECLQRFKDNIQRFADAFETKTVKDEKLEALIDLINEKQGRQNQKMIVFTTYGDTAEYLYRQIKQKQPDLQIACVTGQIYLADNLRGKDKLQNILTRFAPYSKLYKERDWSDQYAEYLERDSYFDSEKREWNVPYNVWQQLIREHDAATQALIDDELDIIIATDCLSEGQNLQDADMVVNYDIHWNPVRLIQRFGRIDRIGSRNAEVQCVNFWPTTDGFDKYLNLAHRITNRMAAMLLAGTETLEVSEAFKTITEDNPLIDRNAERLLRQLSENSISDIEEANEGDGQALGLQNFSLETFRQDFLDYLNRNREQMEQMPCGVFSGFKIEPDLFENIPESFVAVLGYPHRKEGEQKKTYQRLYLMLQPTDGQTEYREFNRAEILELLRRNRNKGTYLPDWIVKPSTDSSQHIRCLTTILDEWMQQMAPRQAVKNVLALANAKNADKLTDELQEDIFHKENFDLIAWEYITRNN
jgi:ERCC4-related helicase